MYYAVNTKREKNMSTNKKVTILARITAEQSKKLKEDCDRKGIKTSAWIRMQIDKIRGQK